MSQESSRSQHPRQQRKADGAIQLRRVAERGRTLRTTVNLFTVADHLAQATIP